MPIDKNTLTQRLQSENRLNGVRWTRATARAEFLGIKLDLILKKSIIEL